MNESEYHQPFIDITPIDQYPEVHDLVSTLFPNKCRMIHNNIYVIFCNLLLKPKFAVSRSRDHFKSFNGQIDWYDLRYAIKSQDLLAYEGFIKLRKGYKNKPFEKGFSSVVETTEKMDRLLKGIVLKPMEVDPRNQAILTMDRKPLTLNNIERLYDHFFESSPLTREMLIADYNSTSVLNRDYFSKMSLGVTEPLKRLDGMLFEDARQIVKYGNDNVFGMATNVFFTSMFTKKGCGRLYQRCESFQNVERKNRKYLTINGSKTKEADFSSTHINLAYFLSDAKTQYNDQYDPIISKLNLPKDPDVREGVKKCAIVVLNTSNYTKYAKAMNWNHRNYVKLLSQYGAGLKEVYETLINVHSDIRSFLDSDSNKIDLLMLTESKVMKMVLHKLKAENINAVPLHDGVIYDSAYTGTVENIMKKTYEDVTDNKIIVKTE
jgi:hypothetical protein